MTTLRLQIRPYRFALHRPLQTAHGCWRQRSGWLLRLEEPATGRLGWGELAPLDPGMGQRCAEALAGWLEPAAVCCDRPMLNARLQHGPPPLAFALGAALAELDGVVGSAAGDGQPWLAAPASAQLLPAGEAMPAALERWLAAGQAGEGGTLKWKVAAADPALEWALLAELLERLPPQVRLRLDANAGWDRPTAERWAEALRGDPRLEWLEQPLALDDLEGLGQLAERVPVALDETLQLHPAWRQHWRGWQVRRPLLEGDPRPLLRQLQAGTPRLMLSTAFETGIGARWLALLAALQQRGPTPTAPGLAPGWCPPGPLFSQDPQQVWNAAAEHAAVMEGA